MTELNTKQLGVSLEKAASTEYDATFIMSASSPDRVNDTISAKAYAPNLGKKLIALWQHKQDQPVGAWHNLRVEGDKLKGDLKLAATKLGLMIKQLIADGVPVGASIGFTGKGDRNERGGIHFKEVNLMECSVVSIPAHPRAMQVAKSYGLEEFLDEPVQKLADESAVPGVCMDEIVRKSKAATLAAMKSIRK